jgi:molybdopterin-guanine dinucleotide biosynthesis protein A
MLTLAIQAGGESRRMGSDKALLPFLGRALILRLLSRLSWIAEEVLVTSNQPENYRFLGLNPIPDLLPGLGALGGLYTVLSVAGNPYVAVVACDMPFASPEIFLAELAVLRETGADAVVPRSEAGTEPFHAVYRAESCLPHIREAIEGGKLRADAWFEQVNIRYMDAEEILSYDPDRMAFYNINTPEELKEAEKIAKNELSPDNTR